MRKHISNEKKLNLILEYINEKGTKPIYSSEYKGYSVGVYLIYLRKLAFDTRDLDEKIVQTMIENGLLDKKCDFIEDKLYRLEKFCRKYPQIWRERRYKSRDELFASIPEEREKVEPLLEQAISDYRYISVRKDDGKISEKDILRLREAGAGYKFEDDKVIESIVKKYGISKNDLAVVCNKYGNIKNFKNEYVKALTERRLNEIQQNIPKNIYERLIKGFDISQPDFIKRNNGIEKLIDDIVGAEEGNIVNLEPIRKKIKEIMTRGDRKKQYELIKLKYGIEDGIERSNAQVAKIIGISSEAVRQSKEHTINALKRTEVKIVYEEEKITGKRRSEFIEEFFRNYDIFMPDEYIEIDKAVSMKLEELCMKENKVRETYKRKIEIYGDIKLSKTMLRGYIVEKLNKIEIDTIEELTQYSEEELIKKSKFSKRIIIQIKEALKEFGLGLGKTVINHQTDENRNSDIKQSQDITNNTSITIAHKSRKIEVLDLSPCLYNILRRNGIENIEDIGDISDKKNISRLLLMKGLGRQYLNELLYKMNNIRELNIEKQKTNKGKSETEKKDNEDIRIEDTGELNKYTILRKLNDRGIITLGDLTKYNEEELKLIAKINFQSIAKIKVMLKKYGLHLEEREDKNIDAELMQAIQELRDAYKQKVQNRIPEHTSAGEER